MFYREAGQFKSRYVDDQAIFPIAQDRWFVIGVVAFAFVIVPLIADEYWLQAVLIPILIYSLAAIGLNLLTGYAGLLSLGTGGFMAVGGYAAYKLTTGFPELNILIVFALSGLAGAAVGILFGLPSLRIKGFYLAVATLAAQFFLSWMFNKVPWFVNYNSSGTITAPPRTMFGVMVTGPEAVAEVRYLVTLAIVVVFALAAKNLVRGRIGRSWMAIRDMDIAAEIIGIRPLPTKVLSFAISSFYIGMAGSLYAHVWLENVESQAFGIYVTSFPVLFMIIVGGLGSVTGSFLGAAFWVFKPTFFLSVPLWMGWNPPSYVLSHFQTILFGGWIIFFLIVEPHGLARLWQIAKEKLRLWPFPH